MAHVGSMEVLAAYLSRWCYGFDEEGWHVSPEGPLREEAMALVVDWLDRLALCGASAEGIIARHDLGARGGGRVERGALVLLSTGESRQRGALVDHQVRVGRVSTDPPWAYYECFVYPGMVVGNLHDLRTRAYSPIAHGTFAEYLDEMALKFGLANWRFEFGRQDGETVNMRYGLRRLLARIGCEYWSEYWCGYSYQGLRCMDLYEKVFTREHVLVPEYAYEEEAHARWYLLNSSVPWRVRRVPDVSSWWQYDDTVCIGQREWIHWVQPPRIVEERLLPFRFVGGQLIRSSASAGAVASGDEGGGLAVVGGSGGASSRSGVGAAGWP